MAVLTDDNNVLVELYNIVIIRWVVGDIDHRNFVVVGANCIGFIIFIAEDATRALQRARCRHDCRFGSDSRRSGRCSGGSWERRGRAARRREEGRVDERGLGERLRADEKTGRVAHAQHGTHPGRRRVDAHGAVLIGEHARLCN